MKRMVFHLIEDALCLLDFDRFYLEFHVSIVVLGRSKHLTKKILFDFQFILSVVLLLVLTQISISLGI